MHDKGLSTNIDWRDKDAYGRSLGARQRQKMQRLRKWNERFRTRDSKERNLKQALGEIDRMASAQGLPDNVRETASVIYRRALDGSAPRSLYRGRLDLLRVRRRPDGRRPAQPRRDRRRVPRREGRDRPDVPLRRPRAQARSEAGRPRAVRPRFASDLELSEESEMRAKSLLRNAKEKGVHSGQVAGGPRRGRRLRRRPPHQREDDAGRRLSEVADISEVTIRNRYHELLEAEDGLVA